MYVYIYIDMYICMYIYVNIYMYIHTLGFLKYMLILRIYMYTVYSSRLIQYPKWDVVWRIPWNSEPFFDPSFYGYPIPKPASLPVNSLAVQRCFPQKWCHLLVKWTPPHPKKNRRLPFIQGLHDFVSRLSSNVIPWFKTIILKPPLRDI